MTTYTKRQKTASEAHQLAELMQQVAEQYCESEDDSRRLDRALLMARIGVTIMAYTARAAEYSAYLSSEWWQDQAQYAKHRADHRCQFCRARGKDHGGDAVLHAHHASYKRLGEDDEIDDLVVLCADCHAALHSIDK